MLCTLADSARPARLLLLLLLLDEEEEEAGKDILDVRLPARERARGVERSGATGGRGRGARAREHCGR